MSMSPLKRVRVNEVPTRLDAGRQCLGWPSTRETGDRTLEAMIQLGNLVAQAAGKIDAQGHPIELVHDLSQDYKKPK